MKIRLKDGRELMFGRFTEGDKEGVADNEIAIRVYEKVGFEVEGRLRDAFFDDGRYHDIVQMGLILG